MLFFHLTILSIFIPMKFRLPWLVSSCAQADGCFIDMSDLQSVCARVANDQLTDAAYQSGMGPITPLDILYGHRASMKAGNLYMAHRCGFTKKVLASTLSVAGFDVGVKARPANYDLWAVGLKPLADNTDRLKQLCKVYFP